VLLELAHIDDVRLDTTLYMLFDLFKANIVVSRLEGQRTSMTLRNQM
jgi:hypothetical protein